MDIQTTPRQGIGAGAFVVAGLSFIPLLGVPLGLVAVVWGLVSPKRGGKLVALLGALGVLVTIALYGGLFYFGFVQRGGIYDDLRGQLAVSQLNQLVPYVELYKQQNGRYPESLEEARTLIPPNTPVMVTDTTDTNLSKPRLFFYQLAGPDHYYLRGVGPDGRVFTTDDILPNPMPRTGLLIEQVPAGVPAVEPTAPSA